MAPGEECDDGNLEDGVGCSATCIIELDIAEDELSPTDPGCGCISLTSEKHLSHLFALMLILGLAALVIIRRRST